MGMYKRLLLLILMFLPCNVAYGCVCRTPDVAQAFEQATVVFAGKAVAITKRGIKFKVERAWKGVSTKEIPLVIPGVRMGNEVATQTSCDYVLEVGEKYLVYGEGERPNLRAWLCSRTALLANAKIDVEQLEALRMVRSEKARHKESKEQSINSDVNTSPLMLPLVNPKIVVSKSGRKLELYSDNRIVRTYRVGLGLSPIEDKVRQGDHRTPEGEFYVCVKNANSKFYLSLGLSYPNAEDAARGLRDNLITKAQHDRIMGALKNRKRPPWDTALGGEIFIHGNGAQSDWTWGCVALEDAEMKELFDAVPLGTKVVIER